MSRLLIEEPPLQVLPSLALAVGLNEAIVLQQLHYLLREPKFGRQIAEHKWIFNTVEEWRCRYFPFWHQNTIKAIFSSLAKKGLIVTCQPEGRLSRRKYYRIDTEKMDALAEETKSVQSNGQSLSDGKDKISPFLVAKTTCTKTTEQRGLKKSEETASIEAAPKVFKAQWKPIQGTKKEQLSHIEPPLDYPSEKEFDAWVEEEGLENLIDGKRHDLYETLCDRKWHHWDGRRWRLIRDWEKYVRALETKINDATTGGF